MKKIKKFRKTGTDDNPSGQKKATKNTNKRHLQISKKPKYKSFKKYLEEYNDE